MGKTEILIVEDEAILSMDMAITLKALGYKVMATVPSGEEALELLKERKPDLVLMDISLSGRLDGIQTAEIMNSRFSIPIIYITGYTDELTLARAKITGPYGYVTKSGDYVSLHSTIEMAIYKNQLERKVKENEYLLDITLENIDDAVITIATDGYIRFLNRAAVKMLRISKEQARTLRIDRLGVFLTDESGKVFRHPFHRNTKRKHKTAEYILVNDAAGIKIPVECTVTPLVADKELTGYVYVIKNIEERKSIEQITSMLSSIVEYSMDAIIGIDIQGRIKSWNSGAERIFGYSETEIIGKNISILTPASLPNELPEKIESLKNGNTVLHYDGIKQNKDGGLIQMSILPSPIKSREGKMTGISFIARDITEKKALEKEVIEIGERERERIGQDLHDSLGQQLTGILLNVKSLENTLRNKNDEENLSKVIKTEELIKNAISQTRELARGLIPMKLRTESLPHVLEDISNYAREVYKVSVDIDIDPEIEDIDIISETQLYHITYEAINNAVKHGKAGSIQIRLSMVQAELILSIKDDGKGFVENAGNGLGLKIMGYRANIIDGSLSIHSEEGRGALVICRVPLKIKKDDR